MIFGLGEYQAARQAAGLTDLSSWPRFRFTGPDAKKFLNGLLTNDILSLRPGASCSACLLTPKGKLLADLELYDCGENLLAVMRPLAAAQFKAAISKRLALSRTIIKEVTAEEGLLYLSGPETGRILGNIKIPGQVYSWRRLDEDGFLLICLAAQASVLREELQDAGAVPVGQEAWEMRRVERGVPLYGKDMSSDNIPLEMRLESSISMTKGCYMGQETISRIVNLGHVNQILVGLQGSDALLAAVGSAVLEQGKEVGRVTSAAFSPALGSAVALATVRRESSVLGTRLEVRALSRPLEAALVDLWRER